VLAALQGAATVREAAALMGKGSTTTWKHLCAAHTLGLVSMPPGRQVALTARCEFVAVGYHEEQAAA